MTYVVDPGNQTESYIDAAVRLWRTTAGLWRTKDINDLAADAAVLATRTSERDSARNGLYVSGVYLSGQTWQAKDATDLANYNAEVTLYNNEVAAYNAALAANYTALSASGFAAAGTFGTLKDIASITLNIRGRWLVRASSNAQSSSFGTDVNAQIALEIAGAQQGATAVMSVPSSSNNWNIANARFGPAPVIYDTSNTTTIAKVRGTGADSNGGNRDLEGTIEAWFIPTQAFPH